MFRQLTLLATSGLLAFLATAAAADTSYDKGHDFSDYVRFAWLEPRSGTTVVLLGRSTFDARRLESAHKRIEQAIRRELDQRGIEEGSAERADFFVRFHTSVDQRFELHADYRYRRPRFRLPATAHVDSYDEGTLVIDVIDADTEQLVWRTSVTRSIEAPNLDKTIDKAVARALRKFPPSSR